MSHDRGCFKCHEDPSEYANCKRADCPKRERFAVEPGGDKSDAPPRPLSEQERAQFPREAVLEHDLAVARRGGPFVGDPGYRSGGDECAKRHDADMAALRGPFYREDTAKRKGVVEVGGELREHDGRALGRRVLPEGVTQADLDAATPLPPLGDSRRRHESGGVTRIITVTEPGYDIALFMNEDGGAEAVITRPGLSPTGVNIAPPAPGRRIVIERTGQRFEVVYKDVP